MGEQGDTPERLLEGEATGGKQGNSCCGEGQREMTTGSSLGHGAAPKTQERPEATQFMAPNPLRLPGVS